MTTLEPAPAVPEPTPVDKPVADRTPAATDEADTPEAGQEVPATDAEDGPVGVAQEETAPLAARAAADTVTGKVAALPAFAEADVAGKEFKEAAFAEARKAGQSAMAASAEAELATEEAAAAALEEAKQTQEVKVEGKPVPAKDAAVSEHKQDQVWILQCTQICTYAAPPTPPSLLPSPPFPPPPPGASCCPASTCLLLHTSCLGTRTSQLAPCLFPAAPCPLHARLFCCVLMSVFLLPQDVKPIGAAEAPAQTQAEAEQPKKEVQEEQAQAEELKQEAPEELAEPMEEDKPQPQLQPASKVEEVQKPETAEAGKASQPAEAAQTEAAKEEAGQQASPMDTATADASGGDSKEKVASGGDGRGVKRPPAPAVVRAAKQARTNQAAGEHHVPLSRQSVLTRALLLPPVWNSPMMSPVSLVHLLMKQHVKHRHCTGCSPWYPPPLCSSSLPACFCCQSSIHQITFTSTHQSTQR